MARGGADDPVPPHPEEQRFVLRRAGPAEAGAVRDLTRRAYAKWVPVIGREPLPMTADYDRAVREHRIDMAWEDGRLVALIETVLRPDDLLIENLAVEPDRQGRGLGSALLAHVEGLAREHGRVLRLYTNALFAENLAFYAAHGFAIEREEPFRGGTMVHMAKRLGAAGVS